MRLFQSRGSFGETSSPPPPPPFSIEREVTRVMPVYLNQYSDGRRLPTPEKVAVMELSNSFERRRLGKHQRILNEISERCRVQEINDLSNKLSAKMKLQHLGKQEREMTFYATTFMGRHKNKNKRRTGLRMGAEGQEILEGGKPKIFEKNYKEFPARRIMRQQTKFEFLRQSTMLPKLTPTPVPFMSDSDSPDISTLRARLAERRQINGPIQLNHYTNPRPDLAPLILPNVDGRFLSGVQSERLNREDTCFSTIRMNLGPRSRTQLTLDSARTDKVNDSVVRKPPPMALAAYGHELSQLQLTSGHSPPPNSIHGIETMAT